MKKGISLIVLVITIIVMIILAASVVITLSNTGIISKANQAVEATNQSQVQDLAALIWAEAYMDDLRGQDLIDEVKEKLENQGVKEENWNITVTDTGVTVTKNPFKPGTLGYLISKDNYGDTVDYSVTVDGTTYSDWQIYYHNTDYVYLIAAESVGKKSLTKGTTVAGLTADELELYEKFRVGNGSKYTLVDTVGNQAYNSQAVAQLIKDYANFANTTDYGMNVVGAIGGPTVELLAAGWNTKKYTPTLTLATSDYGYKINDDYAVPGLTSDGLYIPLGSGGSGIWLASPSTRNLSDLMFAGSNCVGVAGYYNPMDVRPVVCLKASIPAAVGTGDYDFELTK